jgi:hypothetical protein
MAKCVIDAGAAVELREIHEVVVRSQEPQRVFEILARKAELAAIDPADGPFAVSSRASMHAPPTRRARAGMPLSADEQMKAGV